MMLIYSLSVASMTTFASAHTIMQSFNGLLQGKGIYMPSSDNPIQDVNSPSMACNGAPNSYFKAPTDVVEIRAGQEVTGAWLHTLSSTGPDSTADNKVIDSSHKGPTMVYMKKVDDALSNPGAGPGNGWFKIAHAGYENGRWAVDDLITAGGVQKATVPQCITNGDYLVRFEVLALHSASNVGEAQFYNGCASVKVFGGTGAEIPSTVAIPGTYKATDPGVLFNVWSAGNGKPYPKGPYSIPGPAVFTCSSTSLSVGSKTSSASSAAGLAAGSSTLTTMVTSTRPTTRPSTRPTKATKTRSTKRPTTRPTAGTATGSTPSPVKECKNKV